ncbi:MAG: sigma-E processing peptidase SpoIIGA [Lachnospiraceae bacterium]|nr:sigma-E processing peptidase SpoIIGA [Lachnospiraceae bacterium]
MVHYQLYIDSYLLLETLRNLGVFLLLEQLLGIQSRWRYRMWGAVAGALAAAVFLFVPYLPGVVRTVAGEACAGAVLSGILRLCEQGKGKRTALVYGYFWISTICLGGFLMAIQNLFRLSSGRSLNVAGLILSTCIAAGILRQGAAFCRQRRKQTLFPVELKQEEYRGEFIGLVDSGNSLKEPISGYPVCLMEKTALGDFLPEEYRLAHPERFRVVPFHSVGKEHGLLKGFLVEEIIVHKPEGEEGKKNVFLAEAPAQVSSDGRYQVILNRCFGWTAGQCETGK